MAEPGPSAPIDIARLSQQLQTDQLGIERAPTGQLAPPLPNTSYNTSNISGGTINNVNRDFNNIHQQVNHYYSNPSLSSLNPASQSSPSLPPFNDAPIDRISSCFTGRESELGFITHSISSFQSDKPTRFVIYGMPGLGKSQLALQHANLAFTARTYSHIFWLPASTAEKLIQGLARILVLVNHTDRSHPDQAVQIAAARLWLEQSDRHGCLRWLLIIDSATVESAQFLREHLPRQNAAGTILITTRTRNVAESVANVAGQEHCVFELKALSKAQSVGLLLRKAGIQSSAPADLASAEKLVSRIGCLPLAIEQAGSYMKQSGFKTANELQRMYDESGLKEVILWENNLTTYEAASISSMFAVQFQKLDEIDPDAHKLLKTLSFLDPEIIPIDILALGAKAINDRLAKNAERSLIVSATSKRKGVPSELTGLIALICSEERIRAAFRHFEDLSIAQPLYDGKPSLHIHDLTQSVLQQSTLIDQDEGYRALAIALLCNAFQTIDDPKSPQSWDGCEIYVPHFTALGTQDQKYSVISGEYMDVNHSIANYFTSRGRYSEAETLLDRVLAHRRRLLGPKDMRTVNVMHSLAGVYQDLGRYEEAESLYLPVLAAKEKQFGADHLSTLTTVGNLAVLYESQGKLDEAESLYGRALAGQEKQLGADHLSTLTTVNNLAGLYQNQGKLDEAESLYGRALAGQEKQLGADHPSTLTNGFQSRCLYGRALAGQEKQLGADHLSTLTTVSNLAGLYESQGKLDEAESLYGRALTGREKQLGADHLSTLTTVSNLAVLYQSQGKLDEAESLYARALAGQEKQLGADHPSTLITVHNFAYLRQQQGRNQEAEGLYRRALAGLEAKLGPDHPDTQTTLENLAEVLEAQGSYEEAEDRHAESSATLLDRVLAHRRRLLGSKDIGNFNVMRSLAAVYDKRGRYEDAAPLYLSVLAAQDKQFGADYLETLATVNNLALLYEAEGFAYLHQLGAGKIRGGTPVAQHPARMPSAYKVASAESETLNLKIVTRHNTRRTWKYCEELYITMQDSDFCTMILCDNMLFIWSMRTHPARMPSAYKVASAESETLNLKIVTRERLNVEER
ncbi:TPR-like protein [Athelia psychrophila]|uniref:TPR-like protein n=1 Tax=Athelia psychrophila TaxID=1759441 RepID=A0A166KWV0_9AGAM|nr:TPR-like protein [Fibularhizoctonia sp. CBS 109695]